MSRRLQLLVVLIATLVFMPRTASAYLDPGMGSTLLQGTVASVAAILATLAIYWRAARGFIRRVTRRKPGPESDRIGGS